MKIRPYLRYLIRKHLIYFIASFFCFVSFCGVLVVNIPKLVELNQKELTLVDEIEKMKKKARFVTEEINEDEINKYLRFTSRLIPIQEDYYSIIAALERISNISNFLITNYTIDPKSLTKGSIRVEVSGIGDKKNFLEFLRKYPFFGGRLITADEIGLSESDVSEIKISLTFYSGKNDKILEKEAVESFGKLVEQFNKRIVKSINNLEDGLEENTASDQPGEIFDYQVKSNLFE